MAEGSVTLKSLFHGTIEITSTSNSGYYAAEEFMQAKGHLDLIFSSAPPIYKELGYRAAKTVNDVVSSTLCKQVAKKKKRSR